VNVFQQQRQHPKMLVLHMVRDVSCYSFLNLSFNCNFSELKTVVFYNITGVKDDHVVLA